MMWEALVIGYWRLAVIEGVLEADEFPNQSVVAAVGLVSFMGQEVIEIELCIDISKREGFHQACLDKASARHAHEA
jgi:hypothetical protein